jgi:uncharacterized membrane protein YphA (DoxX/SURF4 family)
MTPELEWLASRPDQVPLRLKATSVGLLDALVRDGNSGIPRSLPFSAVFLRLALGLSFLSAVADRFGLWGAFGEANVSWGSFARFVVYTGKLNWFLPGALIPVVAITATGAEVLLGLCLAIGWQTRAAALMSAILLLLFGITMTMALGVKAPLNNSVFSAAGGAFLLVTCSEFPFSMDNLLRRGSKSPQSSSQ